MSSSETRALKAEVESLRIRLQALEERLEVVEGQRRGYEGQTLSPVQSGSSNSFTVISGGESSGVGEIRSGDTELRLALAKECGLFLKRAYHNQPRGTSGRERLKLSNRLYVVLADYEGNRFEEAKVFHEFSPVRTLCKRGSSCGSSVFIGFASQWEAKVALTEAGFAWPSPQ